MHTNFLGQTDRQTDRQTGRQTDRQTDRPKSFTGDNYVKATNVRLGFYILLHAERAAQVCSVKLQQQFNFDNQCVRERNTHASGC